MKFAALVILASIVFLCVRFFFFYNSVTDYKDGQEIVLRVVLSEEPTISSRGQQFVVKNALNQRIYISGDLNTLYHYGDKLAISGKLQVKENKKGALLYRLNFPRISLLPRPKNPLSEASLFVRKKSSRLIRETLPNIPASLLLGIVFGAKEDFPDTFFQNLKITGVLHVIAASGMNVSFFTGAVMFSLGKVLKRQVSILIGVFAVVFYSFLVGFEPSILRASIMAIIAFTASFFGRQNLSLFSLFLTGFLMLLWQPAYLFDVGFELSFMATLGIVILKPVLEQVGKLGWFDSLREDLLTTLSAQIVTFPILLGTFGSTGLLSLPVNLLVLWTVPILMLLGSLAILVGLLFPLLGKAFLLLSLPFLVFFEKVVTLFGSQGWNLQMELFPWPLSVGYYLLVASVFIFFKRKSQEVLANK